MRRRRQDRSTSEQNAPATQQAPSLGARPALLEWDWRAAAQLAANAGVTGSERTMREARYTAMRRYSRERTHAAVGDGEDGRSGRI
jgi:hypothetical protein